MVSKAKTAFAFLLGVTSLAVYVTYTELYHERRTPEFHYHSRLPKEVRVRGNKQRKCLDEKAFTCGPRHRHFSLKHSTDWETSQEERICRLRETCAPQTRLSGSRVTSSTNMTQCRLLLNQKRNMMIDHRHHVVYCEIPKAACTSWKSTILYLTGTFNASDPSSIKRVHKPSTRNIPGLAAAKDLDSGEFRAVMHHYTKFLVVRHPLERLVSAFRDKFQLQNEYSEFFQKKYGQEIVRRYRGDYQVPLSQGRDVTFSEFLRFITDSDIPFKRRMNPHWLTYQFLCKPCHVNYDHVVKVDTLDEDSDQILARYFGVADKGDFFPKRNAKNSSTKETKEYYRNVPKAVLKRVYRMFDMDMNMFGYDKLNLNEIE